MQAAIKLNATVLSGHRIEIIAPELPEGAHVEVIVMLPEAPGEATAAPERGSTPCLCARV